jgi:hypothetical protein
MSTASRHCFGLAALLATVLLLLSSTPTGVHATDIYVSTTGTDDAECGSFNATCATIPFALGLAQINDDIVVLHGTYNVSNIIINKKNITIRGMWQAH